MLKQITQTSGAYKVDDEYRRETIVYLCNVFVSCYIKVQIFLDTNYKTKWEEGIAEGNTLMPLCARTIIIIRGAT